MRKYREQGTGEWEMGTLKWEQTGNKQGTNREQTGNKQGEGNRKQGTGK